MKEKKIAKRYNEEFKRQAAWKAMLNRCHNPNAQGFPQYGGRGIQVCEAWRTDFLSFFRYMGPRPSGRSIDRIDRDGDYAPGNCKWSTPKEQSDHQSHRIAVRIGGQVHSLAWRCRERGLSPKAVYHEIAYGFSPLTALARVGWRKENPDRYLTKKVAASLRLAGPSGGLEARDQRAPEFV